MTVEAQPLQKARAMTYQRAQAELARLESPAELQEVVREHAPLVRRVARRYARSVGGAVDLDDLTSVGVMGLIDAFRRYDPGGGREFRVYAEFRIRGAILDELRRLDPMTQPMRRRVRALEKHRRQLATELGREPTPTELAAHAGVPVERMQAELAELQPQQFVPETELDDIRNDLAHASADKLSLRSALVKAIAELSDRHQKILSLYYLHDLTLREIGEVLDVTEARVCQLHKAAVGELRARLSPELEAVAP
jgi:RNA polymerase sigma factor for flagellar operon FliA